jgi:hypothetical protein
MALLPQNVFCSRTIPDVNVVWSRKDPDLMRSKRAVFGSTVSHTNNLLILNIQDSYIAETLVNRTKAHPGAWTTKRILVYI